MTRKLTLEMNHGLQIQFQCNLCGRTCRTLSRYRRFCRSCREENEAYRYNDWFGSVEAAV